MNYTHDIFSLVRQKTLSVEGWFVRDFEEAPMTVFHKSLSRFKFTIIADGGAASFNLHMNELAGLTAKTNAAATAYYAKMFAPAEAPSPVQPTADQGGQSLPNTPAYTKKFFGGKLGGKTPVDVLVEAPNNGRAILEKQKKFLIDNLEKFQKNQELIDAIDEALAIPAAKLPTQVKPNTNQTGNQTGPQVALLDIGCRPLQRKRREDGMCPCYEGAITFNPGNKYPVCVEVKTYYAPVTVLPDGKLNTSPGERDRKTEVKKFFHMTMEEWLDCIERMSETKSSYFRMNFPAAFKLAEEEAAKNRAAAAKKGA